MKIVITGATGLIGNRVLELVEERHEVWAITRGPAKSGASRVHWLTGDLAADRLPEGLPDHADVVLHLAQSPHYRDFPNQAPDVFNVNTGSTARLLEWSRRSGVSHFVLASSGGVGARSKNFYLATKAAAEELSAAYQPFFGVLALRFFFVYGQRQKPWMLIPRLIASIESGTPIAIAGTDGTRLNPVHVDDAAEAVVRAIEARVTGVMNVAGPEVLTIRRIGEVLAQELGRDASFASDATATPEDVVGDIADLSSRLGAPRWRLADRVTELIDARRRATS
jgi:UDP-glucose 4-epimerase